jgi:hypothetical protein
MLAPKTTPRLVAHCSETEQNGLLRQLVESLRVRKGTTTHETVLWYWIAADMAVSTRRDPDLPARPSAERAFSASRLSRISY